MSTATTRGGSGQPWQYHPRSDNHSKAACWTVLLDLLVECEPFRLRAQRGTLGFGINYKMVGPIDKTLDLVVSIAPSERTHHSGETFRSVAASLGIVLTDEDRRVLEALPNLVLDHRRQVTEVAIALEAKACMTEHIKSLPRLHAEILATGFLAKQAAPQCVTVSYTLVNVSESFVTPSNGRANVHRQPEDAERVMRMIARAVPTAQQTLHYGYDVIGVTAIDCRNDGSAVKVIDVPAAPAAGTEHVRYERMIANLCAAFRRRFG